MRRIMFGKALAIAIATACCGMAPPAQSGYKLGVADKIKIKVQEWPDLTGDYSVNPEGNIALPLVGEVTAIGRETGQLGQDISTRLQQRGTGNERPVTAVEIIAFRPFFILGDVDHPGQYPYRPGLTVLQAIGIAGGHYRPPNPGLLRLERDIAVAEGDARTLAIRLTRLQSRAARLEATISDSKEITFPADILLQKDRPVIASLLAEERATFTLDQNTVAQEAQAMSNIRSLYQQEIISMRGQIGTLKQEQERSQRQLQDLRVLSSKGLGLAPTQQALERAIAQISNEQLGMETAIVRAQESIALAEQKLPELDLSRKRINIRALGDTRDEIKDVQARLVTVQDLLLEARLSASRQARELAGDDLAAAPILLVRQDGDSTQEIVADESTRVEPDDVIKIPRQASPRRRSASLNR